MPQRLSCAVASGNDIKEILFGMILDVHGTRVETEMPLMAAGLDSIATSELANTLAQRFGTELPAMVLFDHPTIEAMADLLAISP